MDLTPYVEGLRRDLLTAAAAGTDETRRTAELLAAALDPAVRLAILDALSAAMADVTAALPGVTVELRMHGREPRIAVDTVEPEPADAAAGRRGGRRHRPGDAPAARVGQGPHRGRRRPGGRVRQLLAGPRRRPGARRAPPRLRPRRPPDHRLRPRLTPEPRQEIFDDEDLPDPCRRWTCWSATPPAPSTVTAADTETSTVEVEPIDSSAEAAELAERTTVELTVGDRLAVEVPERRGLLGFRAHQVAVRVTVPTGSSVVTKAAPRPTSPAPAASAR